MWLRLHSLSALRSVYSSVCVRVPRFAMDFRLVLALSLVLTFSSELVRAKLKGDDCEGNIFCSTSYPIIIIATGFDKSKGV